MPAYALLDVEIFDIEQFMAYQKRVSPLLDAIGARYLARGGELRVYAGDYQPNRLLLLEFPSMEAMDRFHTSRAYTDLAKVRDRCCRCQIVAVRGLMPDRAAALSG